MVPEEFRFFGRMGIWAAGAGAVYWVVSQDTAGTALLVALVLAVGAFVLVRFLGYGKIEGLMR